jgi:FtsH-binding integral membrane protein
MELDNYVLGAAILYIDIIQLFIQILKILGQRRD